MKLQNVLQVIVMLIIGLFVYISIAFGMILVSTRKSVKIADSKILDENPDNQFLDQKYVENKSIESINDQSRDFLNSHESSLDREEFTPVLYRWLWKKI